MGRALEGTITVACTTPIVSFAAAGPLPEPDRPVAGANRGVGARNDAVAAAVIGLEGGSGGIRGQATGSRRPFPAAVAPGVTRAGRRCRDGHGGRGS
jgi:hypothetical protein